MEIIEKANPKDIEVLLRMAIALWPDYSAEDLKDTFSKILASDKFNVLLFRSAEKYVGFIYLSVRTDYVEGSDSTPTGYIEGIYVRPDYRKTGIAQKLLAAGEEWLKEEGCKQIGSDIYLDNQVSYAFHTSIGFKEAGRLIAFIKNL
jgi:aminoglycoside 6'-N-acetyltransferase I